MDYSWKAEREAVAKEQKKTGSVMTKLKELKKRFMKDPEFREACGLVDEEHAQVETRIRERAVQNMIQAEVTRPAAPLDNGSRAN